MGKEIKKQVPWTKSRIDKFVELGMLNEEQEYLMRSRVRGATVTEQAMHLNCDPSTIHRKIKKIKEIYDVVQKEHADIFPPRRTSKEEEYMDTH